MSHVETVRDADLDDPFILEGLPGAGLVGAIAADHLAHELEMELVATCECDGIPDVASFGEGEREVRAPVQVLAADEQDLMVLVSDVPVSPSKAECFAGCINEWVEDVGATPLLVSGLGDEEREGGPSELYGVATGGIGDRFDALDVPAPIRSGQVTGPTGALLDEARQRDLPALGVIATSDTRFPDPAAARSVIERVVSPLTDVDVSPDRLEEQEADIKEAKQQLAEQLGQTESDESSRAITTGMYQ